MESHNQPFFIKHTDIVRETRTMAGGTIACDRHVPSCKTGGQVKRHARTIAMVRVSRTICLMHRTTIHNELFAALNEPWAIKKGALL